VSSKSYYKSPLVLEAWMEMYVMPHCTEYYDDDNKLRGKECTSFTIMLYDIDRSRAMRRYVTSIDTVKLLKFLIENLELEGDAACSTFWRSVGEWLKKLKEVTEKADVKWDEL